MRHFTMDAYAGSSGPRQSQIWNTGQSEFRANSGNN